MEQARRISRDFIVVGYDEPKPKAPAKATKVFEKPRGYGRPKAAAPPPTVEDEDELDWEIEIALEFSARAIKPLLVLPANRFPAAA